MAKHSTPTKTSWFHYWKLLCLLLGIALCAMLTVFVLLHLKVGPNNQKVVLEIRKGFGARQVALTLRESGLKIEPSLFVLATHLLHAENSLKAGRYELPTDLSTLELVHYFQDGKAAILNTITFVEGKTVKELLNQLQAQPELNNDLATIKSTDFAKRFNVPHASLEGWIYPSTYKYSSGTNASVILQKAIQLQEDVLTRAWASRELNIPLKTPYEALILASIVEKETGAVADRGKVASVFINRLRANMLLQTDPTIIYGLGDTFNGNLTRKHLETHGDYNTYTRPGLPPTPICNPSQAAIRAVLNPEKTNYYYFVAKGDGSSYFSTSLSEHNAAVRKYQLNR